MALNVTLTKNDGTEQFTLQATRASRQIDNNVAVRSILATVGELVGSDPVLNSYTVEIDADIMDVAASDYPNSGSYADHDKGFEQEIIRAALEWGPDSANGYDALDWDGRSIDVVISSCNTEENLNENKANDYTLELELWHLDVYAG